MFYICYTQTSKMKIENIEINGDSVANAIRKFYPDYINLVEKQKLYNYVLIFGIRVSTCDTGLPDDYLGAIRLEKNLLNGNEYWNYMLTNGSTDPSPDWIKKPLSSADKLGGTAWVKEGQYIYYLADQSYFNYPYFAPKNPIQVYRWKPKSAGEKFDPKNAVLSTSIDTLIHRSWGVERLSNDSAGCQVFTNNALLKDLKKWAKLHIELYKLNSFTYTLLTTEQFVKANTMGYQKNIN